MNKAPIAGRCCRIAFAAFMLCPLVVSLAPSNPPTAPLAFSFDSVDPALLSDGPLFTAYHAELPVDTVNTTVGSFLLEENEDETFDSFFHLVPLSFSAPEAPREALSCLLTGNSWSRIVVVPLRC